MYTYYISVGSNMGDKRGYISSAFRSLLQHEAISRLVTSPLIETEPWGYTEQDTFVNGVWSCESTLEPHQMLSLIQQLEQKAGRKRLMLLRAKAILGSRLAHRQAKPSSRKYAETVIILSAASLTREVASVNDFINLQLGDIIRLDTKVDEELDIYVGNIKKFTALPGASKDAYAVRVTSVIREEE